MTAPIDNANKKYIICCILRSSYIFYTNYIDVINLLFFGIVRELVFGVKCYFDVRVRFFFANKLQDCLDSLST